MSAVFEINKERRSRSDQLEDEIKYYKVKDEVCTREFAMRVEAEFEDLAYLVVNEMEPMFIRTANKYLSKNVKIKKKRWVKD